MFDGLSLIFMIAYNMQDEFRLLELFVACTKHCYRIDVLTSVW